MLQEVPNITRTFYSNQTKRDTLQFARCEESHLISRTRLILISLQLKKWLQERAKDHISVVDENKIVRNPTIGHTITKREIKDYKTVFDKRDH